MEHSFSATKDFVILQFSVEIKIKDFSVATDKVTKSFIGHRKNNACENSHIFGTISVYPNGANEDTKGWLVIIPDAKVHIGLMSPNLLFLPNNSRLSGTVSIIDNEGISRFPRCFVEFPDDDGDGYAKYLERNFILNQAEEFLNEDVLTLRFDTELEWNDVATYSSEIMRSDLEQLSLNDFFSGVSSEISVMHNDQATVDFTLYDLTSPIFPSPLFHNRKKSFGIYGSSLLSKSTNSIYQLKEHNTSIMKHTWLFTTYSDQFYMSLDEHMGARLLNSSPVIRQCVKASMKEQREKRVDFSVDSQTFKIVLYAIENGVLPDSSFNDILKVYEFSHMYMMEELHKKCAEYMVRLRGLTSCEVILRNIANTYADNYLSSLLAKNSLEYENSALISRPLSEENHTHYDSDWSEVAKAWL